MTDDFFKKIKAKKSKEKKKITKHSAKFFNHKRKTTWIYTTIFPDLFQPKKYCTFRIYFQFCIPPYIKGITGKKKNLYL